MCIDECIIEKNSLVCTITWSSQSTFFMQLMFITLWRSDVWLRGAVSKMHKQHANEQFSNWRLRSCLKPFVMQLLIWKELLFSPAKLLLFFATTSALHFYSLLVFLQKIFSEISLAKWEVDRLDCVGLSCDQC